MDKVIGNEQKTENEFLQVGMQETGNIQKSEEEQRKQREQDAYFRGISQGMNVLAHMETEDGIYRSRMTMIFPSETARLEAELAAGPQVRGLTKAQKEAWNEEMRAKILRSREQDRMNEIAISGQRAFLQKFDQEYTKTKQDVKRLQDQKQDTVEQLFELMKHTYQSNGFDVDAVIRVREGTEQRERILAISQFIKDLLAMKKGDDGRTDASLVKRYLDFQFEDEGFVQEQLEKDAKQFYEAGFVMMLSVAVRQLGLLINRAPEGTVENNTLNQLHALAFQTDLICTAMLVSKDYHVRLEEAVRKRQELLEERKNFILTGQTGSMISGLKEQDQWIVSKYGKLVLEVIGEETLADDTNEQFNSRMLTIERRLKNNETAVRFSLNGISKEEGYEILRNEAAFEWAKEQVLEKLGSSILTEEYASEENKTNTVDSVLTRELKVKDGFSDKVKEQLDGKEMSSIMSVVNQIAGNTLAQSPALLLKNDKVIESLLKAEEGQRTQLAEDYQKNYSMNEAMLREWLQRKQKPIAEEYYQRFLKNYGELLYSESFSSITRLLERERRSLHVLAPVLYEKMIAAQMQDEIDQGEEEHQTDPESGITNLSLIKGKLLLENPVFHNCFDRCRDKFPAAVLSLVKEGYFEDLGLKVGSTETDLNNLTPAQLTKVTDRLVSNIVPNLRQWMLIQQQPEGLLKELMSTSETEFAKVIAKHNDLEERRHYLAEHEFAAEILGNNYRKGRAVYDYRKQQKSRGGHYMRAYSRTGRFAKARKLKEITLSRIGIDKWIQLMGYYGGLEKEGTNLMEESGAGGAFFRNRLTNQIKKDMNAENKNSFDEYLDQLNGFLEKDEQIKGKSDLADLFLEIPLCEYEQEIAELNLRNKDGGTVNIANEKRKEYEKGIGTKYFSVVIRREAQFWTAVKKIFALPSNQISQEQEQSEISPEVYDLYEKMTRYMILDTDNDDLWTERLNTAIDLVQKKVADSDAMRIAELRNERVERMRDEYGEVLDLVLPLLLKEREIYEEISIGNDQSFEELYQKLKNTVFRAGSILMNDIVFEEYQYQILHAKKNEILDLKSTRQDKDWKDLFWTEYKNLINSKAFQESEDRVQDIRMGKRKEFVNLKRYFSDIVKTTPHKVFENERAFLSKMDEYSKKVQKNEQLFNETVESRKSEFNDSNRNRFEAVKCTCEQLLRAQMFENDITKAEVEEAWEYAMSREEETISETREAELAMQSKAKLFTFVAAKKREGIDIAARREQQRNEILRCRIKGASPVVYALLSGTKEKGADIRLPMDSEWRSASEIIDELYIEESVRTRDVLKQIFVSDQNYRTLLRKPEVRKKKEKDPYKECVHIMEDMITGELEQLSVGASQKETLVTKVLSLCVAEGFDSFKDITKLGHFVVTKTREFFEKTVQVEKLQALREEAQKHTLLRDEYENTMLMLSYDLYAKDSESFETAVGKELTYFERAISVVSMFEEVTKGNPGLVAGLLNYFYRELHEDQTFELQTYRNRTEELLKDDTIKEYLVDSSYFMAGINADSLKDSERKALGGIDRKEFTDYIKANGEADLKEMLRDYTTDEIKLFAMVLISPEITGVFQTNCGMELVPDTKSKKQGINEMRKLLAQYRITGKVEAEPDYARALLVLTGSSELRAASVNGEVFQKAASFVELCRQTRRNDEIEKSKNGGKDPCISIQKMVPGFEVPQPESMDDLLEKIKAYANEDQAEDVVKRIAGMKDNEFEQMLFVRVLQNRSVLDLSTQITRYQRAQGARSIFVDVAGREELCRMAGTDMREMDVIDSDMLKNALAQTLSYKWKEGSTSFEAEEKRSTKLDLVLLDSAFELMDELTAIFLKRQAVRAAATPEMIHKSGNQKAIEALKAKEAFDNANESLSSDDVENFIREQAQADGKLTLYAGYLSLGRKEKQLFYTALTRRDILDISKENIGWNRLGMKERDYVNVSDRYELMDQFIDGEMMEADMTQVFYSLLSTQINDTIDFSNSSSMDTAYQPELFRFKRETAVDWKLFARAIQLVRRTQNEKKIADEQRFLYETYSDVLKTGVFKQDMSMMRRNIHNAGTRFTRFLGRRVADELLDQIPDYWKTTVRVLLPAKVSDALNELKPFEKEDDQEVSLESLLEKGSDLTDSINTLFSEDKILTKVVEAVGEQTIGTENFSSLTDVLGDTNDVMEYIKHGAKIIQAGINTIQLSTIQKEENASDKMKTEEVENVLSEDDVLFLRQASERNTANVNQARKMAIERQIDDIINASAEILAKPAEEFDKLVGPVIVKEAGHLINFIRSYVHDRKNIAEYFQMEASMDSYQKLLEEQNIDMKKVSWSPNSMSDFCEVNGYENVTELSEVVGMNITESLLFTASRYHGANSHDKLVAITVLKSLGQEELIDQISSDAAKKLYDSIMGTER